MKIPAHEVETLRQRIAPLDTVEERARYRAGDFPRADRVKDLDKRYRWDLMSASSCLIVCQWYDTYDANDSHVDTVLRKIVAPL